MKRFIWSVLVVCAYTSTLLGQAAPPPNISRWTGSTAQAQPQAFNQGDPINLTWGFMALGTQINDTANNGGLPNGNNNLQTRLNTIYAGGQAEWQPIFQSVFDRWSSISGITYTFEANDDGAAISTNTFPSGIVGTRADLRIGGKNIDGNSGILAYNYFPNVSDMIIDTNDTFFNDTASSSLKLRNVVAHEHGHGLGMSHVDPSVGKTLMEPFVSTAYNGPQFHDILVAQRGYGDFYEKSNNGLGNDIATRATPIPGGAFGVGQSRSIGNSPRINMANNNNVVAFTETDFVSIDSTTDTDFISFTITQPGRLTLLLEALGITYDARPQGNANQFLFNAQNRSDLKLALFDTNGTTQLAFADNTGLGGNEQITFDLLVAGTYFARITGLDNPDTTQLDTQFYGLTASLAAIPEPATLALVGLVGISGFGAWRYRRRQQERQLQTTFGRL